VTAAAITPLDRLCSPYTGIVRNLQTLLVAPDDARLARVLASPAGTAGVIGARDDHLDLSSGGGCSDDPEAARAAAIAEVAERYSGSCVPFGDLVLATAAELGPEAVAPASFALFCDRQHAHGGFRYVPFADDTRIYWIRGTSLSDGEIVYLPAQLVFLVDARSAEAPIGYATSNGLACGGSWEEAVLAGLLELVERDAFMLTWYHRLSLPRIDWERHEGLARFDARHLAATGGRALVDLSPFHQVPVVLATVRSHAHDGPALSVGAAAAPTVETACRRALAEAYSVRSWGKLLLDERRGRIYSSTFDDVVEFADHVHLHAMPRYRKLGAFLDASNELRRAEEIRQLDGDCARDWIGAILRSLEAAGVAAYVVDVTAPDIAEAGLAVAKVVAPALCALSVRHDCRFLGGHRIYRGALLAGLRDRAAREDELNPDPHPFP
jgi:ribosomal protein S12 methylthiotransferase accessory factor